MKFYMTVEMNTLELLHGYQDSSMDKSQNYKFKIKKQVQTDRNNLILFV